MKKLLYVDGCVFRETSRTEKLAQCYLRKVLASGEYELETLVLEDAGLTALNGAALRKRDRCIENGDFSGDEFRFARSFAAADRLVIAVPYWDMSFPAVLKMYVEQICVRDLTFSCSASGPAGLTRLRKVTYITTAGGPVGGLNFGFDYIRGLMQGLFRIADVQCISAGGLDVKGNDPQAIMAAALREIEQG